MFLENLGTSRIFLQPQVPLIADPRQICASDIAIDAIISLRVCPLLDPGSNIDYVHHACGNV